ncbi:MAG TPA: protein kinase [Candidatus Sulfomarinibacteraceae bacterium]|nr:protein kinase [Candidatus Sulfomarinibacteraceae bacterium]
MIGARFAQFEIKAKLGEGGMGEVWLAEDTKLGRQVALKILPADVAGDAERMARFEREAKVLASLNHQNIAHLYGLESIAADADADAGRTTFLVMELVEGEDLSARIERGAVPVDEAVRIALQIAEALEAAHEQGIVHRDLKPANIKLRPDGTVKVLDFGLAKAWDTQARDGSLSMSPTLTQHATAAGVILGTAAYMSPEQAAGVAADRRADIWAFGVVLWEMLTGHKLFEGETVSHVLASVLKDEIEVDELPNDTPPRLNDLLERCLRKKPRERLQAIGDARIVLEEELADPGGGGRAGSPVVEAAEAGVSRRAARIPWVLAGLGAAAAVALAAWIVLQPPPEAPVVRFTVQPPPESSFDLEPIRPGPVTVSPDGTKLVFAAAGADGTDRLWIRTIDEVEARPLTGTENAQYPFWAPDSRHVGFFDGSSLKRVDSSGGLPLKLCDAPNGKGGSWGQDGTIIFAPNSDTPIHAVSQAGGESAPVTTLDEDRGDDSHRHPWFLPDGRRFLYLARFPEGNESGQAIMVGSLDGDPPVEIGRSPAAAAYASGHLLYLRESTLMARPFDPSSLEFEGEAVPVVEQVALLATGTARAVFSPSQNGALVTQSGLTQSGAILRWKDRSGEVVAEVGEPGRLYAVELSPDGTLAAVVIGDPESGNGDLWILELERGLLTRFTSDEGQEYAPVWSADGSEIVYTSVEGGTYRLVRKAVESSGAGDVLLESEGNQLATGWGPDGRSLLLTAQHKKTTWDQLVLELDGEPASTDLIVTEFAEGGGRLSPDGRWILYQSDASGRFEVYVQPYPGPGRTLRASTSGGLWPRWSADGTEIYYQSFSGALMAVPVRGAGSGITLSPATELFTGPSMEDGGQYDVTGDGRFLVIEPIADQQPEPVTVLMNWPAVLDR